MITEDENYICDICGKNYGKFNEKTGNHSACEDEELERLRAIEKAALNQQCVDIDLAYTDKPCGKCAACLAKGGKK